MEELVQHRQGLYNCGGRAFGYAINPILFGRTEEQIEKYLKP